MNETACTCSAKDGCYTSYDPDCYWHGGRDFDADKRLETELREIRERGGTWRDGLAHTMTYLRDEEPRP